MNVAVITAEMRSGERGGAEAFYAGLIAAIRAAGHHASQLAVPVDESSFASVLQSYLRCYELDAAAFDLVISTKAPTYMVRHPRHVSYLVHTLRVFYDRFESEYGAGTPAQQGQRNVIQRLDRAGLNPPRITRHFAIGHTCYQRLCEADPWWHGVPFSVLHLPPTLDAFAAPRRGEYVFLPGRLHRWKRPDLVVRAFKRVRRDIPLLIAGKGEDEPLLQEAAEGDRRVRFLGAVSDRELLDLYAGAIVVPFVPIQEDYGLITIEAFKTKKPVITCTDSGEPMQFVKDGITGFVVPPDERAIAERIELLIDRPALARAMGERGYAAVARLNWESIASTILSAAHRRAGGAATSSSHRSTVLRRASSTRNDSPTRVTVLDMQPIRPAVGGGRLRLLGLYHDLGARFETTYVGTYDWPGERYRKHRLSRTLTEIDVPLSARHFEAVAAWQQLAGGKTVVDVSFPLLAHHSSEYVNAARAAAARADVVVCSHPWVYPLVCEVLNERKRLVVYDAHNVESVLRYKLLNDISIGGQLVRHAAACERDLCRRADLVLACSHQDRELFHRLYEVPFAKCLVMPNGTFTRRSSGPNRQVAKRELGFGVGPVAVFVGSRYPPNEAAASFICSQLAPALPDVTFVICGGVGSAIEPATLAARGISNLRITGVLGDSALRTYLAAADLAINPMFSGQGTNIKMFDFMAAELPVVTTPVGARGIVQGPEPAMQVCDAREFATAIRRLVSDRAYASRLAAAGRRLVDDSYSWERNSPNLGRLFTRHQRPRRAPRVSVVVATYERQAHLPSLLAHLARQTYRDFEVILVDQSAAPWTVPPARSQTDLFYVHTDVRGAVGARNLGVWYARGDVIAFTDDDCQPDADWLLNALPYFDKANVVGVEGLIISDKVDDADYRAVTNVGFEGTGFMTANLFLRREIFNAIDGFDEQFDHPHFREDTDLGWRACALGAIPFARDVRVYHPPHPRSVDREGRNERSRFFEKDPLLLRKHPERYRALFLKEGHYRRTEGFCEHFARGARKYGVNVDEFLSWLNTTRPNERIALLGA
jgi:glycosyltransferase involved in cell wall biosynthesis/GT2 family glycosyltransferase